MPPPLLHITPSSFPASLPLPTLHPSCHCKVCVSCLTELPFSLPHLPAPSQHPPPPRSTFLPYPYPLSPSLPLSFSRSIPPCSPVTPREVTSAEMCLAGSRCTTASPPTATRTRDRVSDTPTLISIPSPSPNHLASPQCNINEPLSFEYIISRRSTLLH